MLKHRESESDASSLSGPPREVVLTEPSSRASMPTEGMSSSVPEGAAGVKHPSTRGPVVRRTGGILVDNPVVVREVIRRLSPSRLSPRSRATWAFWAGLGMSFFHFMMFFGAVRAGNSQDIRAIGVVIEGLVLAILSSSLTASSCTGERERQTWNALLMSRLSPAQIVIGKLAGGVVPALVVLAALYPMNAVLGAMSKMSLRLQLAELACLFATIVLGGAIGLFYSWANRRTQMAQVFTAGSVLTVFFGSFLANIACEEVLHLRYGMLMNFVPNWFNPFAVLTTLAIRTSTDRALAPIYVPVFLAFCALASAVLVAIPIRRLAKGPDEMVH